MTFDLKYYFAILISRLHYVILIFAALTAAAVTLAIKLPPQYDSSATLLLESPQIPTSMAAPTVNTAQLEQLQVLQQKLMTRPNLLDIARKLNVFPKIGAMTPDDIVTAMQKATSINIHTGNNQAALMTITFSATRAKAAADTVNEYVTRVLSENLSQRTSQAQDTLQFFKQEVDRLQGDLSAQSAKIVAFQNAHTGSLPDTLNTRLQQESTLEQQISSIDQSIASLQDQKQQLIALYQATGQVSGSGSTANASPEAKLLAQAQSDLAAGQAIYAPDNPKLKMLQARVKQLQAALKAQAPSTASGKPAANQTASLLDVQTANIDARIKQLQKQHDDVQKSITALKASIANTPTVAVQLEALQRDYTNIQNQYNAASDRLAQASTGARIEALSKGQKIVVLNAAAVPSAPTKPHRLRIAAYGSIAGLVLALAFVVLLEQLDTSVRRPVELARALDITPIGAIPYMRTPKERVRLRFVVGGLFLVVVIGLPAALYAIDTYYMPLNLILAKVNTKLGI